MITQTLTQELENVLTQLQQQGQVPTVATVKAKMSTPIPMPALISAIKQWKQTQSIPALKTPSKVITDQERILALEHAVASLTERIEQLEKQQQ